MHPMALKIQQLLEAEPFRPFEIGLSTRGASFRVYHASVITFWDGMVVIEQGEERHVLNPEHILWLTIPA